ncbi:GIY-YIG nuclease family protein [candidate division KSB1 bacterium]|nr:GIY-YIG nuclease family protein [candidate division KSB1 bacterium]
MTENKHWLVYILRCRDGSLYTGITNDLPKRLQAHCDGVASRYTRSRLPVKLIYLESAANRGVATKRELAIKRMKRAQKERLIEQR